jgi:hypothetical protein
MSSAAAVFKAFPPEQLTERLVRARSLFVKLSEDEQDYFIKAMEVVHQRAAATSPAQTLSQSHQSCRNVLRVAAHLGSVLLFHLPLL